MVEIKLEMYLLCRNHRKNIACIPATVEYRVCAIREIVVKLPRIFPDNAHAIRIAHNFDQLNLLDIVTHNT